MPKRTRCGYCRAGLCSYCVEEIEGEWLGDQKSVSECECECHDKPLVPVLRECDADGCGTLVGGFIDYCSECLIREEDR